MAAPIRRLSLSLLLASASVVAADAPSPASTSQVAPPGVAMAAATPAPALSGSDKVGPVLLRDETVAQVLELLQRWTGKTVLRPQALPANTYNLTLPEGATRDEALQALETLLSLNGCAVIAQGDKFLKVVPNAVARTETPSLVPGSTLDLPPSGRVAAKVFHLRFLSATEAPAQLAPMLNNTLGAAPIVFARTNSLLITDSISNLQRIESVLAELDRPKIDLDTKSYSLEHANAAELVRKLQALLAGPLAGRLANGTIFSADERTNRLLVIGDPRQIGFFDGLIAQLDTRSDPNTRTEVLPLRHANAPDIATLLTQLVTGQKAARTTATAGNTNRNRTATPTPPATGAGAAAPTTPAAAVAVAAEQTGADEFSQSVTVVADVRSNALVVSGTADDLRLLKDLVGRIDVLLAQVRIEVVIAEVTLTDNASSGLDQIGLTVTGSKLTGFSGSGAGLAITNGSVFRTPSGDNDLSATIGLTSTPRKSDTNILSNPSVTTTHNKEATIFVGESRPVVTGTTTTPGTAGGISTSSSVTQRDIGIQLKVLPLIGQDGSVQLQVQQSVEDILGTVLLDGNEQPRIGRRTTESFVSAKSGEIIVLGGLQRSQLTESRNRLGPIAWIGDLLGGSREETTKTELIIFLRPYVLTGTEADNAQALRQVDASVHREQVRGILDAKPGAPAPEAK